MTRQSVKLCAVLLASCASMSQAAGQQLGLDLGSGLGPGLGPDRGQEVMLAAGDAGGGAGSPDKGAAGPAGAFGGGAFGAKAAQPKKPDRNEKYYYRNKVELSMEMGVLPINIPFVFDALVGGDYSQNPTHYTLVPLFPSLRWQMGKINGPWILRGNTDLTVTFSVTAIPRGPENLYDAFDLGFRRNFVYRNWKATPYFETREGAGFVNAQEPYTYNGYGQGQDFTFTLMIGFGARYNFNSKYSAEVGGMYMHVSNLYLSEPKYDDNGINVCGPWIGFNMRLSRPKD